MTESHPHLDADGLPVPDPDFKAKHKAALMAYFTGETDEAPAMYAADPGIYRDLSARMPGLLVHSAGGACPFQSEGTLLGLPYYFRYRHGHASLEVGGDPVGEPLYSAGTEYGDELDGVLTRTEFSDLMVALVPQLKRASFLWEFAGVKVDVEDVANPAPENWEARLLSGEPSTTPKPERNEPDLRFTATTTPEVYRAWGDTPAEAYARLHEPSQWLVSKGWSEEKQIEMNRLKAIDPTPVNTDNRVFPDPEPVFTVTATSGQE